jgi:hypothetical protein
MRDFKRWVDKFMNDSWNFAKSYLAAIENHQPKDTWMLFITILI